MIAVATKCPGAPRRRTAAMYIMVLGTSLAVMTIGLGALHLARLVRRDTAQGQDFLEARNYARSAVEIGLNLVRYTNNWRATLPQGAWRVAQPLGRGTYSLGVVDAVDGNFANNQDDPITMTGTGAVGLVTYTLSVSVAPYGPRGMSCLASALHGGAGVSNSSTLTANAPVSSNANLNNALSSTINANVEAAGSVTNLGTINGTIAAGAAAKEMPASNVFDSYVAQATSIPITGLMANGSTRELKRAVLTPTLNPLGGGLNAKGLYVINCGNTVVKIQDMRLHGSLILLDPGAGSSITGAIHWQNYDAALPVFMVRGSMEFNWTGTLSESATTTNFNPAGAPYGGVTDTDSTDTYPGVVRGLVYLSGSLNVTASETIEGVVIAGGTVTTSAALAITHDSAYLTSPPAGFEKVNRPMLPVPGTWKHLAN